MFYMIPNPMFDNTFQSWMAAARDQATAQLIATLTLQKAIQSRTARELEHCSWMVEEQVDRVCQPATRAPVRSSRTKVRTKHAV